MKRRRGPHAAFLVACLLAAACSGAGPAPASPSTPAASPSLSPAPTAAATQTSRPTATPTPSAESALDGDELGARIADRSALLAHLEAFQRLADATPSGNRATGTPGFEASVDYVTGVLVSVGYSVRVQPFESNGVSSFNLLVQRDGTGDGVVMIGAHLDSVAAGPGINDNGSGVAALLAMAEHLRRLPRPERTIRLAFWGAEEGGPFGSRAYVASLADDERAEIVAYLNLDMLASPNAVHFVYDEAGAAAGSDALTARFAASLEAAGVAWDPIDLEGDSDHGPFVEAGVPTGGLFSGGIEPVTAPQAVRHGAIAGQPADACSHAACDTIDNVDVETLARLARALADVVAGLAAD